MENNNYKSLAELAFDDIFDAGKCEYAECQFLLGNGEEWHPHVCEGKYFDCPRQDDLQAAIRPYLTEQLQILAENEGVLDSLILALKYNNIEALGHAINRNMF